MSKVYYTGKKMFDGKKTVDNFAMLVEDGKILAAGPQAEVACPDDARREELSGWVTPGILDCHVHLVGSDMSDSDELKPRGPAQCQPAVVGGRGGLPGSGQYLRLFSGYPGCH